MSLTKLFYILLGNYHNHAGNNEWKVEFEICHTMLGVSDLRLKISEFLSILDVEDQRFHKSGEWGW